MAVFALAVGAHLVDGRPIWLLLVLGLTPDLAMIGYLAGPRLCSLSYNVAHTYVGPLALGAAGLWSSASLAMSLGLVWAAHIGADRLVWYGLKDDTGFKHTHLSTQPVPADALAADTDSESMTANVLLDRPVVSSDCLQPAELLCLQDAHVARTGLGTSPILEASLGVQPQSASRVYTRMRAPMAAKNSSTRPTN